MKKRKTPTKVELEFAKQIKPAATFKRTVLPAIGGILVMVAVFGAFNAQLIEAQVKYRLAQHSVQHTASAANNTVTTGNTVVSTASPDPQRGPLLTIPAINVEAPIVIEPSFAEWKVQVALRSGVVHYGTTALPGENGNVVILGHSSGQAWAPGEYKFVFTLLDKLKQGDLVYADYNGTRYTYKITGSSVVSPTDVSQIQPTATPTLSLVTCTPVGTSRNRLIVHAEQISPVPGKTPAASSVAASDIDQIPSIPDALPASASSSLWQRIQDLFR